MSAMTASERSVLASRVMVARAERFATLTCSACGRDKPDAEFPRKASVSITGRRRGRAYECLACLSLRRRKPRRSLRGDDLEAVRSLLEAICDPHPKAMQCVCAECEELRAREFARRALEVMQGGAPSASSSAPTDPTGSDS